jgi:hypothetical protein
MIWRHIYVAKSHIKRNSIFNRANIEILMTIYGFVGSYWLVVIELQEKIKNLIFFIVFGLKYFKF